MGKKGMATRAFIRKCALELFMERGFKDVSMTDVCRATGLSRGGLYAHYGSTREIFAAIIDALASSISEEVLRGMAENQPATQILDALFDHLEWEMTNRRCSLSLAFQVYYSVAPPEGENPMLHQYRLSSAALQSLMEYGTARGEFQIEDPKVITNLLLFSYQGVRTLSSAMPIDDKEIPRGVLRTIRGMIVK